MKSKPKHPKSWIKRRGRAAQYSFSKKRKLEQDLGRDGKFTFIVPASIPYDKFIVYRLETTGFFK